MAGPKSKIVRGALAELADIVTSADDLIDEVPSDQYLSRRLNLKRLRDVEGGDTLFEGKLLDMPQWTKIDNRLNEISQQNEYDMDPDYFDDEGIDVSEINILTDTKDQVMGEAYFHYKSDGKFSDEVVPEFLPKIYDDLEKLRASLGMDNKTFATLLEDSGYGPTTNYYSSTEELKGWGLKPSFLKD
jgi:hypothetical protein